MQSGDRVRVLSGSFANKMGEVDSMRMAPPRYDKPLSVCVFLEDKADNPHYDGTWFLANNVEIVKD